MKKKRNLIIIIVIVGLLIIGLGLFLFRNKLFSFAATGNPSLTLSPSSNSVNVNSNFNVNILLDTSGNLVSAAQIASLHFDPTVLQVIDADSTTTGVQIARGSITNFEMSLINTVDNTAGTITYAAGTISNDYNGSGTLAVINFKSLNKPATSSAVTFDFTPGSRLLTSVTDANGNNILSTVVNGAYTVTNNITVNLNLALSAGTNFATSGTIFAICPAGSSAATSSNICGTSTAIFQKTDVSTDASGNATFTFTTSATGNYDYKIHANGYLVKAITNTPLSNPLTLSFGALKAGDLDGDNTVTAADFIAFRVKFLTSDIISDFDHDGKVTASDFVTFRKNYLSPGN